MVFFFHFRFASAGDDGIVFLWNAQVRFFLFFLVRGADWPLLSGESGSCGEELEMFIREKGEIITAVLLFENVVFREDT